MIKEYEQKWDTVKEYINNSAKNNLCLGKYNTDHIQNHLKHFMISMSRYKFAVKMLKYKEKMTVLEIGCAEGFGGLMFEQETNIEKYVGVDMDKQSIEWAKNNISNPNLEYIVADIFDDCVLDDQRFDAVLSLDVIEHIETSSEKIFMRKICEKLNPNGCCIVGTPNVTMSEYASQASKIAHINLYTHERLYNLMDKFFENVFMFSMNDEVVSTGFEPMACYIFAVGAGLRTH